MEFPFVYREGRLCCESVGLDEIAQEFGTPAYVYSASSILASFLELQAALAPVRHKICYSVKANPNLSICALLAKQGAGADVTSGGELYRALRAGFDPGDIVFAGVGKSEDEMRQALEAGIGMFSVESESELRALSRVAVRMGTEAPIALRVNPDVDPRTHRYITTGLSENKFGIPVAQAREGYRLAARLPGIRVEGVGMHIGSQMVDLAPMAEAARSLMELASDLLREGHPLRHFDIGGGYAIPYGEETPEDPRRVVDEVAGFVRESGLTLLTEPGRRLVGRSGALLLRVLYRKRNGDREFVVADAGMNALIRPALYGARHRILPVREHTGLVKADVVGPVCESADCFIRDSLVPDAQEGDLVAVMDCGAYGFSMASEYNGRPRPAEVLVRGDGVKLARPRQTYEEMIASEVQQIGDST